MIPAVFCSPLGVIAFFRILPPLQGHRSAIRPINHGYALRSRSGSPSGTVMFAVMSVTHWLLAEDYRFLLLAPMGWAWWTSIFRFTLNKLRELDWRYVSASNWWRVWQFLCA